MPIPLEKLDQKILVVDEATTVRQAVARALGGEPHSQSDTVIMSCADGGFRAFTLVTLNDHAEKLGRAVLDETLGALLSGEPQARTVEWARTKSLRRAEDDAWRAPGKRLVILKDGQPLGIVTSGAYGGGGQATVVQLYQAEAEPAPRALDDVLAHLRTDFLLLRPKVVLAEVARALSRTNVQQAIVPLYDDQCVLLTRQDVAPFLNELGRYALDQIYTLRKTGESRPGTVVTGTDVNRFRPEREPSQDEIVLLGGKPVGYRPGPARGGAEGEDEPTNGGDERFVNTWFRGHSSSQPLARGKQYHLGLNVGAQRADSYTAGETYQGPVDQDLHVGLVGDPDVWQIGDPAVQKLHIPAGGDSKEIFFPVTPLKQGQQQLTAHFYHRNHLIQTVEITGIQVAISEEAGAVRGQKPVAVTLTRAASDAATSDRDANLYIEWLPDQDRYRFTYFSAPHDGQGEPLLYNARVAITPDQMAVMADAAREAIETNLVMFKEGNIYPFQILSTAAKLQPSEAAYQKAILALARLGYRWFIDLFYKTREPELKAEAEAMGDLLSRSAASGPLRLQIVSSDFYLPWNLLYTAPSGEREPLTKKTVSAEGLWGFRHVIEQVPARDLSHVRQGPVIDASDGLNMSANVNMNIDRSAYKPSTEQVEFFKGKAGDPMLKLALTTRFSEDEVLEAFQDEDNADEIVYFYCHAVTKGNAQTRFEESRLILTQDSQALELADLITGTFGLPPMSQAPLVFLNACGSGQMDARFYDSFVQFMRDQGARTVIGTLNDTPVSAGAEFGKRFFDRFLQGGPENSAARSLFELRRKLLDDYRNPIGLSYALFYSGDTFVKRKT
jgi:hypothetical protein